MKFFAKISDLYFPLFQISEGSSTDPKNDFVKISKSFHPKDSKKLPTKEWTIHPQKIHEKTAFKKHMDLIGDFKGKESKKEYTTLYEDGYSTRQNYLLKVWECTYNDGFLGSHSYKLETLPKRNSVIKFPENQHRPYWMSFYFTSIEESTIENEFKDEDLDHLIFIEQSKTNVVVILKFLRPEWELIENPDYNQPWNHQNFQLKKTHTT